MKGHDGTWVVEFADLQSGKLQRDSQGNLVTLWSLAPIFTSGGLSDFDENNSAGDLIFSQIHLKGIPEVFQIFNTKRRLIPSPGENTVKH